MKETHQYWLLQTLLLAKKRAGFCAPNPAVGAVVVKNNELVGKGFHYGAGYAHAEVDALDVAGEKAKGADLYVSLEPCCHYGRTPPCTEKIKASGIKRVFFAFLDPNPVVASKGQKILNDCGILCTHVEVPEITVFYQAYAHWMNHKTPYVIAKLAMTADGFIAKADGAPLKITGEATRILAHQNRLNADAILTTAKTIAADNPQFNVRINDEVIKKPLYILDTNATLSLDATVFETTASMTIFHGKDAPINKINRFIQAGVRCVELPLVDDRLDLGFALTFIGDDGKHTLWVESGPKCFNAFVAQALVQKIMIYVSQDKLGQKGMPAHVDLESLKIQMKDYKTLKSGSDQIYLFDV